MAADQNLAEVIDENPLRVKGALTFATVPPLAALAKHWATSGDDPIVVDLSGVSHSDSAGLALLLQWAGELRVLNRKLKFINIPHQVEEFIRINGLATLLLD